MTYSGQSADDTIALHQLASQYAHIVDDADWERLREIFTDDIEFDTSQFGNPPLVGIEPVIASYVDARHPVAHHPTNPVVTTDADGTVRMRTKVLSLLGGGLCGSGTYDDVCVKTPDGWRISRRTIGLRRESQLAKPPPRPAR
ncbi:MAG: nuclear transport factor 2 family protein [Acidimicrobiia bacterium]